MLQVSRVIQILARRTKNNPILLGEPGVGKTAIAEGLAYAIVHGCSSDGSVLPVRDEAIICAAWCQFCSSGWYQQADHRHCCLRCLVPRPAALQSSTYHRIIMELPALTLTIHPCPHPL
jgi:hypothetical protein